MLRNFTQKTYLGEVNMLRQKFDAKMCICEYCSLHLECRDCLKNCAALCHMITTKCEDNYIRVLYIDNTYGNVKDFALDELLNKGEIKKFYRSGGWAAIGIDPIRVGKGYYEGQERRRLSKEQVVSV